MSKFVEYRDGKYWINTQDGWVENPEQQTFTIAGKQIIRINSDDCTKCAFNGQSSRCTRMPCKSVKASENVIYVQV